MEGEHLLVLRPLQDVLHPALQLLMAPLQLHHVHPVDQLVPLHCLRLLLAQEPGDPEEEEEGESEGETGEDDGDGGNGKGVVDLVDPAGEQVHVVVVDGSCDDEEDGDEGEGHEFGLEAGEGLLGDVVPPEVGDDGDVGDEEEDDAAEFVADVRLCLEQEEGDQGYHPDGHFLLPHETHTQRTHRKPQSDVLERLQLSLLPPRQLLAPIQPRLTLLIPPLHLHVGDGGYEGPPSGRG